MDDLIDSVAKKQLKAIVFRTWVVYRNAKKFRRDVKLPYLPSSYVLRSLAFVQDIELDV